MKKSKNSNITLIGMPGAGKSSLGVLLAKALGMGFADTDILIQQREGRVLQDIIDNDGIDEFLKTEESVVCGMLTEDTVIATGGSVVYSERAMESLKSTGRIVYLHVSFEKIRERLTNIITRGIVIKQGRSLKDVYDERHPLYMKYADITVNCSEGDIENCVCRIISEIKKDIKNPRN